MEWMVNWIEIIHFTNENKKKNKLRENLKLNKSGQNREKQQWNVTIYFLNK